MWVACDVGRLRVVEHMRRPMMLSTAVKSYVIGIGAHEMRVPCIGPELSRTQITQSRRLIRTILREAFRAGQIQRYVLPIAFMQ